MAEFITGFETADGVKKYDYNSLANKPEDGTGTIISGNADYAEVGEWSDGNPGSEDRLGYFVAIAAVGDNTIKIRKATSEDDVKGVTVFNPAFSGNAAAEKYVSAGVLYPKYSYVGLMGIVSVIDNGTCAVGGRCMPANDGTAIPSTNNMGYGVLERIDENHVLIAVEPGADMIQRIKTQIVELQNRPSGGGNGASDWNQHDANGRGYINSRPFYEVDGGTIIYENTDLQLQSAGGESTEAWLPNQIDLIEGESYYVSWEGKSHKVTATRSFDTSLELHKVGEFYIRTAEGDTILDVDDNKTRIYSYEGLTSVSLSISTTQATIKKIDKKFLPDDIGGGGGDSGGPIDPTRIPDMYYTEERQDVEILPTSTAIDTGNAIMGELYVVGDSITLVEGKTYKVIYNGVEYECVAIAGVVQGESSILLGDVAVLETGTPSGAYPFVIATNDYMVSLGACAAVIPLDGSSNITVSIVGYGEEIHHLSSKYIKDMYYTEERIDEILPATTIEFAETDGVMMAQSEEIIKLTAGNTYTVNVGGTSFNLVGLDLSDMAAGAVALGNLSILGVDTGEPFLILATVEGTMFVNYIGVTTTTVSIVGKVTDIHQIDEKYIPKNKIIDLENYGVPEYSDDKLIEPNLNLSDEDAEFIRTEILKGTAGFKIKYWFAGDAEANYLTLFINCVEHRNSRIYANALYVSQSKMLVRFVFGIGEYDNYFTIRRDKYNISAISTHNNAIDLYSTDGKLYKIQVDENGNVIATKYHTEV